MKKRRRRRRRRRDDRDREIIYVILNATYLKKNFSQLKGETALNIVLLKRDNNSTVLASNHSRRKVCVSPITFYQ